MSFSFFPRQDIFFDFFEKSTTHAVTAARELQDMLHNYDPATMPEKVKSIKDIEHLGDDITHETLEKLYTTFVTPLDREDIYHLTCRLDDILDLIDVSAGRFQMFDITEVNDYVKRIADILVKSTEEVHEAVFSLRNFKKPRRILDRCVIINTLENQADEVLREAMRKLFTEEKDPIEVIKWKKIYENLETATDKCEDVANVIEAIVLKNA